jgi:DNA-binding response OmpR family regulator
MTILLIEDYEPLRKSLTKGLREAGFAVDAAADGAEGLWQAQSGKHDVIILDLMLPKLDGLSILQRLREENDPVHVLILTAKDMLHDRVRGLNLGADDYLVKPFAFDELLARVRALLRRKYESKSPVIQVADLEIDTRTRTARRGELALDLTAREYAILHFLALRAGQVVTRTEIWDNIYDWAADANSNIIDVYIGYIRKKMEQGGLPRLIHTRRGMGYVLGGTD